MASDHKLNEAIQRLYESSALRDDLNDSEAKRLLEWGEQQLRARAPQVDNDDDFDQQSRYMRQLMKGINRFVGQREFMDSPREDEQLGKVTKWLPHVGMDHVDQTQIAQNLPPDKSDMGANLSAILNTLTPTEAQAASAQTASAQTASAQTASAQTASAQTASAQTASAQAADAQAVPSQPEQPADSGPAVEHGPYVPYEPLAHQPFPPSDYQADRYSAESYQADDHQAKDDHLQYDDPQPLTDVPVYPSEQPTDDATDRSQPAQPPRFPGDNPDD
ncbi:MAG: hypothetical protein CL607_09035 [Anaerolineaceae bacterium]|nr:hypothetical protein [Anaerolineaceae bacterium]